MEYVIIGFLVVIVLATAFIGYVYNWLAEKQNDLIPSPFLRMPEVMVRTYNMETIHDSFLYTNNLDRYHLNSPIAKYIPKDAVKHHIRQSAERIGQRLLKDGFIEVIDRPMLHENPFVNRVDMRLRVFKDGAVEQTLKTDFDYDDGYPSYGDPDYYAGP